MFDFFNKTKYPNPAQNAYQPQKTYEQQQIDAMRMTLQEMLSIVDAMCKVYVANHAKEIADRGYADKFYQTDQPIIDRANVLELERKIKVAEMELSELTRSRRI